MSAVTITVINKFKTKIITAEKGGSLLSALSSSGFYVNAPCGGRGICGKCKIKLIKGEVEGTTPDSLGYIISCRANLKEDICIQLNEISDNGLTYYDENGYNTDGETGYGIALDLGTTTLAFYLMDLKSGTELDSYNCLNPQAAYGADVISRITACADGKLSKLNSIIIQKTNYVIDKFINKHTLTGIKSIFVCGNTTMLHLFANEDPSPLGVYPFKPVFTDTRVYDGKQLGLNADLVTLLPSVSAYVGSDITAGILSSKMTLFGSSNMLIDIGTNGEIALFVNDKIYCASTAAGPALEGANIECGMGGVEGAIDSVKLFKGKLDYTVINNTTPKGICGSGLIDVIAVLLETNTIDNTGAFTEDGLLSGGIKDDRLYITDDIYLSQKDVREFQLAKSAICAGIKTLAYKALLPLKDIKEFFIAGGMGYYISHNNAVITGLLPREIKDNIKIIGNSAGLGAKMCMLSKKQLELCQNIAKNCKNIELSEESYFLDEFINNMNFSYQANT